MPLNDIILAILIGTILIIMLIASVVIIFLVSRRKINREKLKQHENEIKNLTALTSQITNIQEEERRRLANLLHDDLGALLFGIRSSLFNYTKDGDQNLKPTHTFELIERMSIQLKSYTHNLYPVAFEHGDLIFALNELKNIYKATGKFSIRIYNSFNVSFIPRNEQITLYRITSEWIKNSVTHGMAKNIQVYLYHLDSGLVLEVLDDGISFNFNSSYINSTGMGLKSVIKRINQLDAEYEYSRVETDLNKFKILLNRY